MNDHNKEQQLRYLEEVCIPLHRAGFETQPLDESQLPVHWNGAPLCRITGKGSVFYRREDVDTPLAEDALLRVEDIAARTAGWRATTASLPTSTVPCWQEVIANTVFNSLHGIGTTNARA